MRRLKRGLRPISDNKSSILILGSFPGPVSLKMKQYYAHPRNHFWRILQEVGGVTENNDYGNRKKLLKRLRVALWDIIGNCNREGASDHKITSVRLNNLKIFLKKYPKIKKILLNGKRAEKYWNQYFGKDVKIPAKYIPSSSSANANYDKKFLIWSAMLRK